ncbi:MAG: site-specific integrase [Balneolales bacterium]
MASLKKRNKYYSLTFKTHIDGKPVSRSFALGTKSKQIADKIRHRYQELYELGEIDPFSKGWSLKEYEKNANQPTSVNPNRMLFELKEQFLKQKTNTTAQTQRTYAYIISQFMVQVGETMPVTNIDSHDIRTFCLRSDLALASQKNYLRHLKNFFNWVVDQGDIEANPCNKVLTPKTRDNLVEKVIDEEQLQTLFKTFRNYQLGQKKAGAISTSGQMQFWFKPLITLAFYTGLRRKEVVQLQWSHINLADRFIRVTDTKNGLERTVLIIDKLYYRLLAWKKFMGNPKEGLVFPSPKSTQHNQIALVGNNVSKRFRFYADMAGFKPTINFHGLRHSCATFLLRNDFQVIEAKNMLGHRSIEVTNRYVHLVPNDLLASANRKGLITMNR